MAILLDWHSSLFPISHREKGEVDSIAQTTPGLNILDSLWCRAELSLVARYRGLLPPNQL